MISKKNVNHILILGIGFLWCSSVYLNQEQLLLKYMSSFNVYIVDMLYASFTMALGILLFGLLYKNNKDVKKIYLAFMGITIIVLTASFIIKSKIIISIALCLICLIGTSGFGCGYHFSLVTCNTEKKYRGRVFALGYSIGIIGTYLLTLIPKSIMLTGKALLIYIPLILVNTYLVMKESNLSKINTQKEPSKSIIKYKYITLTLIFLMALVTSFSSNMFALSNINSKIGFAYSRLYYSIGLIITGIIADKRSREVLDITTIISLFFPLLAILLVKEKSSVNILACINYMLLGVFVIFRTTTLMNLKEKSSDLIYLAAYGLLVSRLAEGIMAITDVCFKKDYIILIIVIVILLSLILIIYLFGYYKINEISDTDVLKEISIKYSLSIQEQKILNLLVNGNTNQEIADKLFLSINTVKTHVGSIYKKTGKKKKELQRELLISKK